jgi:hypothetical protein
MAGMRLLTKPVAAVRTQGLLQDALRLGGGGSKSAPASNQKLPDRGAANSASGARPPVGQGIRPSGLNQGKAQQSKAGPGPAGSGPAVQPGLSPEGQQGLAQGSHQLGFDLVQAFPSCGPTNLAGLPLQPPLGLPLSKPSSADMPLIRLASGRNRPSPGQVSYRARSPDRTSSAGK